MTLSCLLPHSKLKYIQSSGQNQAQAKHVPGAANDPVTAGQPAVPVRPPAPVAIQIIGMSATLPNLEEVSVSCRPGVHALQLW